MFRERLYVRHHQKASPWMPLAYLERLGFYQFRAKKYTENLPNIYLTRKHGPENIHPVMLELATLAVCVYDAQ